MIKGWRSGQARRLMLGTFEGLRDGSLELICPDRTWQFGDPAAVLRGTLAVHDERFFTRALFGGDTGMGESYMDGDWSSPDLVSLIRLAVRNLRVIEEEKPALTFVSRMLDLVRHRRRGNTPEGSRRNIKAHYDLSNEFFSLFLDSGMMYSCAFFERPEDSLEQAQLQKIRRICRKLRLGPDDRVLEIGTGWGGFAAHAAAHCGCRVTTTTISREQHAAAAERFSRLGPAGDRIELLSEDYRNLRGRYDKIVSIEMFEAVGLENYDAFFSSCDRLLERDGSMLMQTITINEQKFPVYRKRSDWIQKHIFPGSELASVSEILRSLARATTMSLFHLEDIGTHYARTLEEWRRRFLGALQKVRALGFDDRFIRMWDYYLAFCAGAFHERHISDVQLVLTKNGNPRALVDEPWEAGISRCMDAGSDRQPMQPASRA